jgi:hypothetical protein
MGPSLKEESSLQNDSTWNTPNDPETRKEATRQLKRIM